MSKKAVTFTIGLSYDFKLAYPTANTAAAALTAIMGGVRYTGESMKDRNDTYQYFNVEDRRQFDGITIEVGNAIITQEEFTAYVETERVAIEEARDGFGVGFADDELQLHYRELVDNNGTLIKRSELISGLRGTEFEEHAYSRN